MGVSIACLSGFTHWLTFPACCLQHGNAALHLAAENGHEKVADLLLKHKAFVNAKSKLGVTPLHMAAQNGFNNFVKLLIQTHGAATDALSLVNLQFHFRLIYQL